MAYARQNWNFAEIAKALSNPVNAESGPKAHSSKHAVEGELASNKMFQAARVNALIIDDKHKESNVANFANASKSQQKKHPGPAPEASTHSVLDNSAVAGALVTALNAMPVQSHLGNLDSGNDMKLFVNFANPIGKGTVHRTNQAPMDADIVCLFVYLKPNPANKDIPIFQTVVPHTQHKVSGTTHWVKI